MQTSGGPMLEENLLIPQRGRLRKSVGREWWLGRIGHRHEGRFRIRFWAGERGRFLPGTRDPPGWPRPAQVPSGRRLLVTGPLPPDRKLETTWSLSFDDCIRARHLTRALLYHRLDTAGS